MSQKFDTKKNAICVLFSCLHTDIAGSIQDALLRNWDGLKTGEETEGYLTIFKSGSPLKVLNKGKITVDAIESLPTQKGLRGDTNYTDSIFSVKVKDDTFGWQNWFVSRKGLFINRVCSIRLKFNVPKHTPSPATPAPPTPVPETNAPSTDAPDTLPPPTGAPDTPSPPTDAPDTRAPHTLSPHTRVAGTDSPATFHTPLPSQQRSGELGDFGVPVHNTLAPETDFHTPPSPPPSEHGSSDSQPPMDFGPSPRRGFSATELAIYGGGALGVVAIGVAAYALHAFRSVAANVDVGGGAMVPNYGACDSV